MTYSSKYIPERYTPIEEVLDKLKDLAPGARLNIDGLDRDSLSRFRYLIYDWLSHHSLKTQFRIKTDYDISRLTIIHLGTPETLSITKESSLGGELEALLRELIIEEPTNPEEIVLEWKREGKVTSLENASLLLRRYEEVMK